MCGACQRAAAAAAVTQDCGATLVVCPTPIVHQWYALLAASVFCSQTARAQEQHWQVQAAWHAGVGAARLTRCFTRPQTGASHICRRDEILRHIRPGALKLVLYEGQPQPGAGARTGMATHPLRSGQQCTAFTALTALWTAAHCLHCPHCALDSSALPSLPSLHSLRSGQQRTAFTALAALWTAVHCTHCTRCTIHMPSVDQRLCWHWGAPTATQLTCSFAPHRPHRQGSHGRRARGS